MPLVVFSALLLLPGPLFGQITCPGSDAVVLDCNGNGTDDHCDLTAGSSADANTNGIPDECDSTECLDLWSGFEPVPPFAPNAPVHGVDFDGDGSAWSNPDLFWFTMSQGCPAPEGKAIKCVAGAFDDRLISEYFRTVKGTFDCGASVYELSFDARSEAQLNPRIDWQLTVRDALSGGVSVLIHWASTQSNYPGVTGALGGDGRGHILVKNPAGGPAFINTGYPLNSNTCYRLAIALNNVTGAVSISINGTPRVTVGRLQSPATRMDSFDIRQVYNGQASGGVQRMVLDNFQLCTTGAAAGWPDCNRDCIDDAIAIGQGSDPDANSNGIPDECEADCNGNGTTDDVDIASGQSEDCDSNAVPDECQADCNSDGTADGCDPDCNSSGLSDVCEVAAGSSADCNGNGIPDGCDVTAGTSQDCLGDGTPDECQPDCNGNSVEDACDLIVGTSADMVGPGGTGDGIPDECQADCNGNQIPDEIDIAAGTTGDCNENSIPDECDLVEGTSSDCTGDGTPDDCQTDCNWNGLEDACDLAAGTSQDCNSNGTPDECDIGEESVQWRQFPQIGRRWRHAMAYDSARGVTVLFGDAYNSLVAGETWEWNGFTWDLRATTGPGPRETHAMAYDSARGVVVLFGGTDADDQRVGETWEWDGDAWNLRSTIGPSPRRFHAMAYDSLRQRVVLFGGWDPSYDGETWEWDGNTWTLRATSGPGPRAGHAMAYDSARGVTVLFSGSDSNGVDNETWEWNGTFWVLRSVGGPSPRGGHALAYDSTRGVTVLFGGAYYTRGFVYPPETWEWDGIVWAPRSTSGASPRSDHAMVYDSGRGEVVLFGGYRQSVGINGETWGWNGSTWTLRHIAGPPSRSDHAMAYDSTRGKVVLFGGAITYPDDSTYEWDGSDWTVTVTGGPAPQSMHAMAYDEFRRATVLFSGYQNGGARGETWEWNGSMWTLRATTGPSRRENHAMAYDAARRVAVLFGGNFGSQYSAETWEWNGSTWLLRATSGPSPRHSHAMIYDDARGVIVLFGGQGPPPSYPRLGDTWEWNGSSGQWTLRSNSGPPPREEHAMAYDSARRVTVLYGGDSGGSSSGDTWEWNGSLWNRRSFVGPGANAHHAMAYDRGRRQVVMFPSYFEELWSWGPLAADCNGDAVPDECAGLGSDCNTNGVADICESEKDCNRNGVLDECESIPPCALIIGASSWRTHGGGVGRDAISVNIMGRVGFNPVTSESRSGGMSEARIVFDVAPSGPGPAPVTLEERTCGDGGSFVPYTGTSTISAAVEGNGLVLTFIPELQNARTYRITLGPNVSTAPGQSIEVRVLAGDIDSSGFVNAVDRSLVVGAWTSPAGYSAATDLDLSGRTDAVDRAMVVAAWTGTENCAP